MGAVDLSELPQGQVRLAEFSLGIKDEVAKELKRRERARQFKSLVVNPDDPFHCLMQWTPFVPYAIFYGGRDARKSWSISEALVRRANALQRRVLCTRQYQNSISDSVHRLLADMIERLGLEHRFDVTATSIKNPYTGSEFIFKGLQKPREIKSTEGIDDLWVAEAQDVTAESWEILEPTIRKEGSQIIVDFNVTSEDTPTHGRFVTNPPPGAVVRMVNYDQNPFLSQRSKDKIEHLKRVDFEGYRHIYLGVPRKQSDAIIFRNWEVAGFADDLYMEAIRKGGRIFIGMDHGFANDPYAIVRFFILDECLYIEHEAFGWKTEFAGQMKKGLKPGDPDRGELEQLLDTIPDVRRWPIKADNSRPETISFIRGKGYNATAAEKWDGCVEDGIAHIQGFRKVIIHPRCRYMQEEARMYRFKVDQKQIDPRTGAPMVLPVVVDAWNHGWDAVRYGLDGHIQRRGALSVWAKLGKGTRA